MSRDNQPRKKYSQLPMLSQKRKATPKHREVGCGGAAGVDEPGASSREAQEPGKALLLPLRTPRSGAAEKNECPSHPRHTPGGEDGTSAKSPGQRRAPPRGKPERRGGVRGIGVLHSTVEGGEPTHGTRWREGGIRIIEPQEGTMAGRPKPTTISTKQARIAMNARQITGTALTSLSHHMDLDWLREAFRQTRKSGAAGIDGVTATEYARNLEDNLQSLLNRAKSGTYRAPPVRRVYIPKGSGGKTRPIGIPTLEDKVLQRAVVMLLEPVYEESFYDFSHGFRPRRSPLQASDALQQALWDMGGGTVLDVDVQSFFDTLRHEVLRDLLTQRVADKVVVRLIGKWLRAGVMEDGACTVSDTGSPQGGVISPLLSNIYLHEVLDQWWVSTVLPRLRGRGILLRFADDFVMVFSDDEDARRVHEALSKRFSRFGLTLHPEKTRLVSFRRPPPGGGGSKPGSFTFLGFQHYWARSRKGKWVPKRKTSPSRFSRGKRALNEWMSRVRHWSLSEQRAQLSLKLQGHFNYYGVPGNSRSLSNFAHEAKLLWKKWLSRRSQRGRLTWVSFMRVLKHYPLPPPRRKAKGRQLQLVNLRF